MYLFESKAFITKAFYYPGKENITVGGGPVNPPRTFEQLLLDRAEGYVPFFIAGGPTYKAARAADQAGFNLVNRLADQDYEESYYDYIYGEYRSACPTCGDPDCEKW